MSAVCCCFMRDNSSAVKLPSFGMVCASTSTSPANALSTPMRFCGWAKTGLSLACATSAAALTIAVSIFTTGLSPMNAPVKSLMPSRPIFIYLLRHLLRFLGTGSLRQLHFGGKVDWMAVLGKDIPCHQNLRSGNFPGLDSTPKRQGVIRVGAQVPDRRKAPTSKHLLYVCFDWPLERGQCPAIQFQNAHDYSRTQRRLLCQYNRSPVPISEPSTRCVFRPQRSGHRV